MGVFYFIFFFSLILKYNNEKLGSNLIDLNFHDSLNFKINYTANFSASKVVTFRFGRREEFIDNFWSTFVVRIFSKIPHRAVFRYDNNTSFFSSFRGINRFLTTRQLRGDTNYFMAPNFDTYIDFHFDSHVNSLIYSYHVLHFDIVMLSLFILGALIVRFAPFFCTYQAFYYVAGCILTCFLSCFILFFIIFKIFYSDLKSVIFSTALIGTASALITNFYFNTLIYMFMNYFWIIASYIICISLLTSAFIYYKGPINDRKIFNLVKWGSQLMGYVIIFLSARSILGSIILVALCLSYQILSCFDILNFSWNIDEIYLTEEEFKVQGMVETHRAIDDLRTYLNSDKKVSSYFLSRSSNKERLRDFIEGDDHLSFDEMVEHENEFGEDGCETIDEDSGIINKSLLTEDSSN